MSKDYFSHRINILEKTPKEKHLGLIWCWLTEKNQNVKLTSFKQFKRLLEIEPKLEIKGE
jgi:hypothetical protein